MQVTQTVSEGLKREFKVVLPMARLEEKLNQELLNVKDRVQINGFRPGKVPLSHVRRLHGRSIMMDVVQNSVNEANQQIVETHNLKLAMQPQVTFPESKEEMEKALEAKGDLAFSITLEILPDFDLADISDISLTKQVARANDSELDEALERMAQQNRSFSDKGNEAAISGDQLIIGFTGKLDGVPFEGGSGESVELELGSNSFIPGFEDQLVGAKAGESRVVNVTFPDDYQAAHLAGKAAEFDVTVEAVKSPSAVTIDEELAKAYGMDSLDDLKDAVRKAIERDFETHSRRKLKKVLFDALDEKYNFDLPPTLLDQEFDGIWKQVEQDMQTSGKSFPDEGKTEDESRAEYKKIAERRVRLGLVLNEMGDKAQVQVTNEEVSQALTERARQFPGQEKIVWDFFQKNPQALAQLRAPIFEEKVVDHILTQVKLTEVEITKEALFADEGDEDIKSETVSEKPKKSKAKKKTDDA